jgi:hypothetical protein
LCRLLGVLPGQVVLLTLKVQGGQGAVGSGMLGVETHGLLQGGEHGLNLAELSVGYAQEIVGRGHLWGQTDQGAKLGHGRFGLPLLQVADTKVEAGLVVLGIEP